jgi:cytochrome c peroxidase
MILQGFSSGMLIFAHTSKLFKQRAILRPTFLVCISSGTFAHAETNTPYKQEPISPIPLTVEVNKAKAALGESLFSDTRFSKNNTVACATCHQLESGGDDNVSMGISLVADQHVINTPSIFNAQYNFRQNWDGSAATLEEQIDMVMVSQHEFNNQWDNVTAQFSADKDFTKTYNKIYKGSVTKDNIVNALVEYEKSLNTPNSAFDRYLRNEEKSLTQEEINGYMLFKGLGFISCHQGMNVGGNLYQKFGVFYDYLAERGDINKHDFGKFNTTDRQRDKFVFKVPSLRNVAVTAPYLHDGSAKTLEDAINIMGKTQLGRTLTADEISLIKAFLNSLTGQHNNKILGEAS